MFHDKEEWCKIWREIDLSFQNWHEKEFDKFWPEHKKISKIWTLISSFWTNYIIFEVKIYRRVIFHDNKEWCKIWRKPESSLVKWHEEFAKFLPEHSKASKMRLWLDPFIQSRICMSLKIGGFLQCSVHILLEHNGCFWKISERILWNHIMKNFQWKHGHVTTSYSPKHSLLKALSNY